MEMTEVMWRKVLMLGMGWEWVGEGGVMGRFPTEFSKKVGQGARGVLRQSPSPQKEAPRIDGTRHR